MNHTPLACAALLALAALPAQAAEHFCGRSTAHPIDKTLAAAAQRSGGVTVDLSDAQSAAYDAWDKELNRVYAALLKAVEPSQREALRAAQRAWLAFDKAQGHWVAVQHADEGTSAALNLGGAELERRRARVCELLNDLEGIQATR
ncbi:MAG: DUF1311 domain-containing protein [Giesbergeria sp.]|nr:DUF1311 domain-containing protein [Giesbergeria sp.]